ncbi:MAG: alpha-L-fucosidase, partial [Bacteroidetes bacterium]
MKILLRLFALFLIVSFLQNCQQSNSVDYLNETAEAFDERMEWWRDARFGMFIHWG